MGEQRVGYMALRVSVSGRMNEPKFQKAKAAAEALAEFHGDQVQAEIQEMVPAEWDIFREKKTRATVHRLWGSTELPAVSFRSSEESSSPRLTRLPHLCGALPRMGRHATSGTWLHS